MLKSINVKKKGETAPPHAQLMWSMSSLTVHSDEDEAVPVTAQPSTTQSIHHFDETRLPYQ